VEKNYWVISPNVYNDATEERWKEVIRERKNAYIGFDSQDGSGVTFHNQIKEGDIILVAQGANRNKHSYLCGLVNSPAIEGEEEGTPGFAQRRSLTHTLNEQELDVLELDFTGCAYGQADRIPALYNLKPLENVNDQRISFSLTVAINQKRIDELMNNIKLSAERQIQVKALWEKFKSDAKEKDKIPNRNDIEKLITEWHQYKEKITNDTLTLDDYTNTKGNKSALMPGYYLCNFLERTTRELLGSSKPGTAFNFGVKLNNDNTTYYIKSLKKTKATRQDAENFFNKHIKGLLKRIVSTTDPLEKIRLVHESNYSAKQILMKLAVLDNLSDFLYIYSTEWLDELYNEFIDDEEDNLFSKSNQLCIVAKSLLGVDETDVNELILMSRFLWKYENAKAIADDDNPNVIMYGPPGTGKTYSVRNTLDFVCQGDRSRYEFLQFHPSFAYEDFIEGIKPKGVSKDGNIRFELVNGVFKKFCIKAKNNLDKSYYFVVDEINRANLSAVLGETLSRLEKDYRHDGKSTSNLIRTQYSTLIEDLIEEDHNKYKHLAYFIDKGAVKFGVPKNVYFIGMMNDVDKSIDAFDLALRRRFKWIATVCDYEVIEEETRYKSKEEFSNIDQYIKACESLNIYISKDLNLGNSYEFGHSFFMKMRDIAKRKTITPNNLEVLFNLFLRPTLKEYMRALYAESELDANLNEALRRFKEKLK